MLPEWLTFYPSIASPEAYVPVMIAVVVLVAAIMRKSYLFVPLMMWACPWPKLFSIGITNENFETIAGGTIVSTARPGGSLGELVVFAGFIVLVLRLMQGRTSRRGIVARPLLAWIMVVLLSSVVGVFLSDVYRAPYVLHALRYAATLACYFIARHLTSNVPLKNLSKRVGWWLFVSGNTYVALAFIYYLLWGCTKSPWVDQVAVGSGGVWRNYLFFFDYAYDYGLFGSSICALDMVIYSTSRNRALRVVALVGGALSGITVVMSGERGCLLLLAATLLGLGWLVVTKRTAMRVRAGVVAAVIAVLLATVTYSVAFPAEGMTAKMANTSKDIGEDAGELAIQTGVDPSLAYWIGGLRIGDWALRLSLMAGSVTYFLQHPLGVGYDGELAATGWFAHHDLFKLAVEEGALGLIVFAFLIIRIVRFCSIRAVSGRDGPASDAARTVVAAAAFAILAGMIFAVTTIFSLKFGFLFWTLLGVTDPPLAPGRKKQASPARVVFSNRLGPPTPHVQGTPAC